MIHKRFRAPNSDSIRPSSSRYRSRSILLMAAFVMVVAFGATGLDSVAQEIPSANQEAPFERPENSAEEQELLELYIQWWDAERGSEEKADAQAKFGRKLEELGEDPESTRNRLHLRLAEERLGEQVFEAFEVYWEADSFSSEKADALARFRELVEQRGLDFEASYELADWAMVGVWGDSDTRGFEEALELDPDSVGGPEPLPPAEVEITLEPSTQRIVAGELWTVIGKIKNQSERPIWIVSSYCALTLAAELYGQESDAASIFAHFPTGVYHWPDDVRRIDAGQDYTMLWKIDPILLVSGPTERPKARGFGFWRRIGLLGKRLFNAWAGYLFFVPGEYVAVADVHIWSIPPEVAKRYSAPEPYRWFEKYGAVNQYVLNPGDSLTQQSQMKIQVDASPWVLIFGASVGGVLCYLLRHLGSFLGRKQSGPLHSRPLWQHMVGLTLAVLLTIIMTILLSRLSTTFLPDVGIRDLWGAIVTGFLIQWFGLKRMEDMLGLGPDGLLSLQKAQDKIPPAKPEGGMVPSEPAAPGEESPKKGGGAPEF